MWERRMETMGKRALVVWSLVALVSGVGWVLLAHPATVIAVGVVALSLVLCVLSWTRGA
jgi:hypothetical protein